MPKTPSMLAAVLFGSIGLLWTGTVSSIQGLPFHLPPVVTIQLMPPINEDNPGNTDVTGAQIIFANPGPNTLADYNTILRLPPIKSAAVPERHRNRLAIVAGNKEGSTFLHFEAPELWLGEHHYAEVIFLTPQHFSSADAWAREYGYNGENAVVYRNFIGPEQKFIAPAH